MNGVSFVMARNEDTDYACRRACLSLSLALIFVAVSGCNLNEFDEQRTKLNPLLNKRTAKGEVVQLLGSNFLFYRRGETNWEHLTNYFSREPRNRNVAVRKYAEKWPNVMLYSSSSMMTWVFLDDDDRMSQFVVGAQ